MGPLLLIGLLAGGCAVGAIASARQDPATIDLEADAELIARFGLETGGSFEAGLKIAILTLAPGQSSMTLISSGTTVIAIQAGLLMLVTDRAIDGTRSSGDGTAGTRLPEIKPSDPTDGTGNTFDVFADFPSTSRPHYFEISTGAGAILREGTFVRFVARGTDSVQVLIINLTPGTPRMTFTQ